MRRIYPDGSYVDFDTEPVPSRADQIAAFVAELVTTAGLSLTDEQKALLVSAWPDDGPF